MQSALSAFEVSFLLSGLLIITYNTVKPVLSGPVLNGHPLLSGQLQKSRKFLLLTTLNVTSIKRSPLLSGHGQLLQSPSEGISIVFTCIKRSLH